MSRQGEYGTAGFYGILTPQGNPTVEPELRVLLPPATTMIVSRLINRSPSLSDRLIAYLTNIEATIETFDTLTFDAVGFACTGSSYLVPPDEEKRLLEAAQTRLGYPVITAAGAVELALGILGTRRLALISPYPEWLTSASREHWVSRGFAIEAVIQIPGSTPDRHGIYGLTTPAVLAASAKLDASNLDAIILTGTGMPTLRSILALEPHLGCPILSSNLCLAWAMARIRGAGAAGPESRLYGGWADRLPMV